MHQEDNKIAELSAQLQRVLGLHEQRVLAYKRWEKAFREYVALEDQAEGWEDYQDAIKEAVEAQLALSRPDLAAMVRSLQELEKQKLQLTAKVQAGKEKAVVTERVDEEVDWVWEREEKGMRNQLNGLVEEINLVIDSLRVELQDLAPPSSEEANE
ncbi:uncharacterized protein ACA1_181220 [Acanthamoeba castellanii str. Neff]|uniref:Uncharacterized protein n=1 Tax=Acanthamoeba castellanii (strain ATCC 30010 / Neff) TaxID=1257118 RepID=L8GDC6_ACACF|nr:uncharacterized protein ACA1_181220 [Acanthamoeba castellanii str. Neff]ELR10869.1 hypothetical protein ACA1_181220 [Acanthamoeba castellanii str. Neff]